MSLYGIGTLLIGICLIAFLGFTFSYAYSYVAAIGKKTAIDLGTYDEEQETSFINLDNIFAYIGIFALFILGFWFIVHSQRKGGQVPDEV